MVPSQTELLFDLGLEEQVVGITKFCVHPQEARLTKSIIGGTKNLNVEKIRSLQPDLIIANKEENELEAINQLQDEFPVWVSDVKNRSEAIEMIQQIGTLTDRVLQANQVCNTVQFAFRDLRKRSPDAVLYLIWQNPWMAAGCDTFIHSMVEEMGWVNVIKTPRYPVLLDKELPDLNPDLILLSSEPFPFREKHVAELQTIVPGAKVILVDGEMFSWYGSRMVLAPKYFNSLEI